MSQQQVWMAGPALDAPGGMSAVVHSYRQAGLFDAAAVRYLSTYTRPGLVTQLRVFGAAVWALLLALLGRRVRLLHVHSASRGSFWRKSLLCGMARLMGVPYVFHLHSGEFPAFYERECGGLARWWVRVTFRGARSVMVLTEGWAQQVQSLLGPLPCFVAHNPVVLPSAEPMPRPVRRRLLFLGRIRQKKGAFDLLRAFQQVQQRVPDATLVMAGDGEIDAARALCSELGLAHGVVFTGWIDGAAKNDAMAAADVFVLPSYFEGLPVGILEAMGAGLVVVATPVGGIADLITSGQHGVLVQPGDTAALANALLVVLQDAALGDRLTANAWQRVQAHEAGAVARAIAALYERVAPQQGEAVRS